jgi:hypothetical protein
VLLALKLAGGNRYAYTPAKQKLQAGIIIIIMLVN